MAGGLFEGKPTPVLLIFTVLFNAPSLFATLAFALTSNQCSVIAESPDYDAYAIVFAVCFAINLAAGIYLHFRLRYRSDESPLQRATRLAIRDPAVIAYEVWFLFSIIWGFVMLGQIPGDLQCDAIEKTFYGFMLALPYLLLVALGGMIVGFFINLCCECGRPHEDDVDGTGSSGASPSRRKSKVDDAENEKAREQWMASDEPVAPLPEPAAEPSAPAEEAPPPVAPKKKKKKSSAEEEADDAWLSQVNNNE